MWGDAQARVARRLFFELTARQFQWAVIGNAHGLPNANPAKDIDVIVERARFAEAVGVLFNIAKTEGFRLVESRRFEAMLCSEFYSVCNDHVQSLKIDIMMGFVWRGASIIDSADLVGHTVVVDGVKVPDITLNGFILWIKPLLTGAGVKSKYTAQILDAIALDPQAFRHILELKCGNNMAKLSWELLQHGNLTETIPLSRALGKASWLKCFRRQPLITLTTSAKHLWCIVTLRMHRRPGSMIGVVGPDGVGKTTFIDLLKQELARILVKDPESIQVTHFRPNLLPNIKQLLSGQKYDASAEEFCNPHRAAPASPPSSLVRLAYYWLDYLLGYWLVNRRKCAQGTVMIFDRYFYDFIVDPRRSRINLPTWVRKLFLLLTPQPDLVFFLDCDADTVYARKQELTRDEIERQLVEYRKLVIDNPNRFIRLDAHQSPQISCRQALLELVLRSFQRV